MATSRTGPPPLLPSRRGGKTVTTIRLADELLERVDRYAKAARASRAEAIAHLLQWALDRAEE